MQAGTGNRVSKALGTDSAASFFIDLRSLSNDFYVCFLQCSFPHWPVVDTMPDTSGSIFFFPVFQHFLFPSLEQQLWQSRADIMGVLDVPLNAETNTIDEIESRNKKRSLGFQPIESTL